MRMRERNCGATRPAQFAGRAGEYLRGTADQTHGTIDLGGGQTATFNNIREVIGGTNVHTINPATGAPTIASGAALRAIISSRHPGTITIELPSLDRYPRGPHAPEVYPGTIYVPRGTPCPHPR
jgi:predicted homoserine dehydrogenase-like protein